MTSQQLETSALANEKPAKLTPALEVMWLARAGKWHQAHDLCQNIPDPLGAWLHAHLHREEGDLGNASYWYHRASRNMPKSMTINQEWHSIVAELLQ